MARRKKEREKINAKNNQRKNTFRRRLESGLVRK
jgi:hypothetical protein